MKQIISIQVEKSGFYASPLKLEFSEKLNCIMGGRGTGKSTLVHFLESCFDPMAESQKTTFNILKTNLGIGSITVIIQDSDGKKYKIVKTAGEFPAAYEEPSGSFISFQNIEPDIRCDFYKSQSIEEIGRNPTDRLELIDKMLAQEKAEIQEAIRELKMSLDDNAQAIKTENARLKQIESSLVPFDGLEEEMKALLTEAPKDTKEHTAFEEANNKEKIRAAEKRYTRSVIGRMEETVSRLEEYQTEFPLPMVDKSGDSFLNKEEVRSMETVANQALIQIDKFIKDALTIARSSQKTLSDLQLKLAKIHEQQQNEFSQLRQKIETDRAYYIKSAALTKRAEEKKGQQEIKKKTEEKRQKLKILRTELIKKLVKKCQELLKIRTEKVGGINAQFKGLVRITLTPGGITTEFEDALRNGLKGSNMRYNTLIPNIVSNFSPQRLAEIIHQKDEESLKKIMGIDKERSTALINALHETDAIYQIETICSPDLPEFLLKVDDPLKPESRSSLNYKRSDDLSTGQRCTTVLPIIFAVSNNPLIIDQPEDNLDNKYISKSIHDIVEEQKEMRQLIFITHNPNIPVLADAEANFFLSYDDKKSSINNQGDVEAVKQDILDLMEGGREAFRIREELYKDELI